MHEEIPRPADKGSLGYCESLPCDLVPSSQASDSVTLVTQGEKETRSGADINRLAVKY